MGDFDLIVAVDSYVYDRLIEGCDVERRVHPQGEMQDAIGRGGDAYERCADEIEGEMTDRLD